MKSTALTLAAAVSGLCVTVSARPTFSSSNGNFVVPRNSSSASASNAVKDPIGTQENGMYYNAPGFFPLADVADQSPSGNPSYSKPCAAGASGPCTDSDYQGIIDQCLNNYNNIGPNQGSFVITESGSLLSCYTYGTPFDPSILNGDSTENTLAWNKGCQYQKDMPLDQCMIDTYGTAAWLQTFQGKIRWGNDQKYTWVEQMAQKYFENSQDFRCSWAPEIGCTINFFAPPTNSTTDAINAYLTIRSYQGYVYYLMGIANALKTTSVYVPDRAQKMIAELYKAPQDIDLQYADASAARMNMVMGIWGTLMAAIPVPGAAQIGKATTLAFDALNPYEQTPDVNASMPLEDIVNGVFDSWKDIVQRAYDGLLAQPINATSIVSAKRYLYTDVGSDSPYTKTFETADDWTKLFDRMIFRSILQYTRNFIHYDDYGTGSKAPDAGNTAGFIYDDGSKYGRYAFPVNYRWELYQYDTYTDTNVITKEIRDTPEWGKLSDFNIDSQEVIKAAISFSQSSMTSFGTWDQQWPAIPNSSWVDNINSPMDVIDNNPSFWAIPVCDINRWEGDCVHDQKYCKGHDHDSYYDRSTWRNTNSPNQMKDIDNLGMDSWCAWRLFINGGQCAFQAEQDSFGFGDGDSSKPRKPCHY